MSAIAPTAIHAVAAAASRASRPLCAPRTTSSMSQPARYGGTRLASVTTAAALIFFAYIGFEGVSTAAQEAQNPQKNMPIGIILSLAFWGAIWGIAGAFLDRQYGLFIVAPALALAIALTYVLGDFFRPFLPRPLGWLLDIALCFALYKITYYYLSKLRE